MSKSSSVRNKQGLWVNVQGFREEALHHEKYGYYCTDPWGTPAWQDYWETQLQRCLHGHTSGGAYITGDHYFYLNFSKIMRSLNITSTAELGGQGKKELFPAFYDGDYNYFHCLDIAWKGSTKKNYEALRLDYNILDLNGGKNLCVGKSRRKGFSYKNGAIAVNRFNTIPRSVTVLGAYIKDYLYPEGTMAMVNHYINYLNEHTGWAKKREFVDKINIKKASYEEVINGVHVEKGYKSMVMAVTCKDNPDAMRGKDGTLILLEEAGKFPNLLDTVAATQHTLEDGSIKTGQMVVFGTGKYQEKGDSESDWRGFAEIFYNPEKYNFCPFENIWDEGVTEEKCSFFFPDKQNLPGFIDAQGNSDKVKAKAYEDGERAKILAAGISATAAFTARIQERCNAPEEAFLRSNQNDFAVEELKRMKKLLTDDPTYRNVGIPVTLYKDEHGVVRHRVDLHGVLKPIVHWEHDNSNLDGCVIIYEFPVLGLERGTYLAGYDPVRQITASKSKSLGATLIHKGYNSMSGTGDMIVAEYVGRPRGEDAYHTIQEMLLEFYGATMMYENEVVEVKNYYRRRHKYHLLCDQPDDVISSIVNDSKVVRGKGIHMVEKLKLEGLSYIATWLIRERAIVQDETKKINVYRIFSLGLLEELTGYDRKKDKDRVKNYDRIMALVMIMFGRAQEDLGKVYGENKKENVVVQQLIELAKNQYKPHV